jgi:hypothetical protein
MRSSQGRFPGWASLLLVLAVVFGSPAAISQMTSDALVEIEVDDRTQLLGDWALQTDPDYVFIGNSMLDSRISPWRIQQLADDQGVSSIADGGSYVPTWYLRLKNDVVNAGLRPKTAFIFFRDTALTDRPHAHRLPFLELIMDGDEPVFDAVWSPSFAHNTADPFVDKVYRIRRQPLTADGVVQHISGSVLLPDLVTVILHRGLSLFGFVSADDEAYKAKLNEFSQLEEVTNKIFVFDNHRTIDPGDMVAPKFDEVVDASFLPLILELGQDANIRLVFVHVQHQSGPDGKIPGNAALDRYLEDLGSFFNTAGVGFIDMTGDPDIKPEWYSTGDHIRSVFTLEYTDFFFRKAIDEFRR